jgi:maltose alpha-D-glucosyltransferase / alpha-amylase
MKTRRNRAVSLLRDDPLWYKDAIIYEAHVRAFRDNDGDGIGDFRGLVDKLDYLQDLGITALWLLPFYPSPLRDDGYDIADYTDVNPIYGNLTDFKLLLREAHQRGLRIITELVVNHTSDKHPWFQRARRAAPGSSWRNFYVWSDTPEKFQDARIIFQDFEASNWTWDQQAQAYYWHRFYSHQPDLNFDNPAVHDAILAALDFWLELDIDALRLDAVPYLYERDGTSCENLVETHAFLKKLRAHVDANFKNRMLLAEANQWPEDAVAYFGDGDECHMAFHFPLMPRLFMAIRMEDRFPIIDILQQTPAIPESTQWALFLRNHDELTLEMVTAEDRDYMYRVYAQDAAARVNLGIRRRLAPLLENHRGKIELMNGLLFSLPGTPVLYYGDEIGMGDNIYLGDRNGVRTPMQWNAERNAGFSQTNPQRLYLPVIIDPEYHYHNINVETQQNNPNSLLWWMKRVIALRKRYQAFGRGTIEFLYPGNPKVFVFLRRYKNEQILVVANLSRFMQCVEVDLAAYKGLAPVEMLGRTALPIIGDRPYLLTLGPYAFYWLSLEPAPEVLSPVVESELPALETHGAWQETFANPTREIFERILLDYLRRQRWFAGRGGVAKAARIVERIPIHRDGAAAFVISAQVEYVEGEAKHVVLPVAFQRETDGKSAEEATGVPASFHIARLTVKMHGDEPIVGILFDPIAEKRFAGALLDAFARHRRFRGSKGELSTRSAPGNQRLRNLAGPSPEPSLLMSEQYNTSILYGDQFLLKFYREIEEGIHPEIEIVRALAEKTTFTHFTPAAGMLQYHAPKRPPTTLAALFEFVQNEGDAWSLTHDALRRYFEQILTQRDHRAAPPLPNRAMIDLVEEELPDAIIQEIGPYLESIRRMARRTAEMHLALASITDDPAFSPEPFNVLYQRSTYQTVRTWVYRVFNLLRENVKDLPPETRATAQIMLGREGDLIAHLRSILRRRIVAQRIRCHGDYHLASLLYTGKDFVVIDFEGEGLRPLNNRRHKRSPLRDVASMVHSLYFAVRNAMREEHLRPEDRPLLEPWVRHWHLWVSVAFVQEYLHTAKQAAFLPTTREEMQILLDFYLLGRGVYELRYQLLNHRHRIDIPLQALMHLMELQDRRMAASIPESAAKVAEGVAVTH